MATSNLQEVTIQPKTKVVPYQKHNALLGKLRSLGAIRTDSHRGDVGEYFITYFLPSTKSVYVICTTKDSVGRKHSSISGPFTSVKQLEGSMLPLSFRS